MARKKKKKKRTGQIGKVGPTLLERREKELENTGEIVDPTKHISQSELSSIRDTLIQSYAGLVIRGMMDTEAREELREIIRKEYKTQTMGRDELVDYITRETVGTGVIEEIMADDKSVTDISYNGSDLIVESSDKKLIYREDEGGVDNDYIVRLINKFAHANGRDFTEKNPIFDGTFENVRINAMYDSNTTGGVTMALRVVRPILALTKETFTTFAPMYIYDLFEAFTLAKGNFVIAGETGTGKTELQKLLASFIPFSQRLVLIEDVAETFLKDMFKDKDIFSWITSPDVTITDLVKASLRNNPRWILVSETRGQEAYEMIQAVLSGHSIITTLHAVNARAIPKRMINMAKMGYEFSEEGLESDIRRYFDFGVHIIRTEYKGKTIRYLNEVVYYDNEGDHTVFKQDFVDGRFICQTSELPEEWKRKLLRQNLTPESFKEYQAHDRFANVERIEKEDGRVELDLDITMGVEVGIEELYKYVNNDDIVAIPGDRAKVLREQKERERAQQESIDVGDKVEKTLFSDDDDTYEMVDSQVEQDAKRRLKEMQEQRASESNQPKKQPESGIKPSNNSDQDKVNDSVYTEAVESEAERILAKHRERQKRKQA